MWSRDRGHAGCWLAWFPSVGRTKFPVLLLAVSWGLPFGPKSLSPVLHSLDSPQPARISQILLKPHLSWPLSAAGTLSDWLSAFCLPLLRAHAITLVPPTYSLYFKVSWLASSLISICKVPFAMWHRQRFQGLGHGHLWATIILPTTLNQVL